MHRVEPSRHACGPQGASASRVSRQRRRMQVGRVAGVPVVDLWTRLQERADWRELLSDGLHLSGAGNEAVFCELRRCLDEELPHIHPDALPLDMPLHGDLTADNYKRVLEEYL